MRKYSIGLDYGSLSGRGVLADVSDGTIIAQAVCAYPHGIMSDRLPDGTPIPSGWALQDPADYLLVLNFIVPMLLRDSGAEPDSVIGIGVDFTASTVLVVDENNVPLCEKPGYAGRLHGYAKLWKHHAAQKEADQIQRIAERKGMDFLQSCGGAVSSECMLSKLLQVFHEDTELYREANHFVEAGDWITSLLTGREVRSGSMAACKMMWDRESGYPDADFFTTLEPELTELKEKLTGNAGTPVYAFPGEKAGELSEIMAKRLGLYPGIAVTAPQMDSYAALPATGVTTPGNMLLMAGTSTAMLLLDHKKAEIPGICARVKDSGLPGFYCYAAGQASVGDCFQWFAENYVPTSYHDAAVEQQQGIHQYLTELASGLYPGETGLLALDWWNGNKSCLVDADLSGLIIGLTLGTKPEHIYRALLEATAFGANMIIRNYGEHGIAVESITACGGIAEKNRLLMQIYADVFEKPVHVNHCEQAAALGMAIFAASAAGVSAGGLGSVFDAIAAMACRRVSTYLPDEKRCQNYRKLMNEYTLLHDYFGRGGNNVMRRLRELG